MHHPACSRPWKIAASVVTPWCGYFALLYVGRLFALDHDLAAPAAAWLSNVAFVAAIAALRAIGAAIETDEARSRVPR
jgi:hypothetical protein